MWLQGANLHFNIKIITRTPLCCVQVQGLNKVKQILLYLESTFFKFGSCGNLPLHVDNMGPTRQKEKSITNGICGSWLMSIQNDCNLLSFSTNLRIFYSTNTYKINYSFNQKRQIFPFFFFPENSHFLIVTFTFSLTLSNQTQNLNRFTYKPCIKFLEETSPIMKYSRRLWFHHFLWLNIWKIKPEFELNQEKKNTIFQVR